MSECKTFNDVMRRIRVATIDSPVAVFRTKNKTWDVMFYRTVVGAREVRKNKDNLIGIFHNNMGYCNQKFKEVLSYEENIDEAI